MILIGDSGVQLQRIYSSSQNSKYVVAVWENNAVIEAH